MSKKNFFTFFTLVGSVVFFFSGAEGMTSLYNTCMILAISVSCGVIFGLFGIILHSIIVRAGLEKQVKRILFPNDEKEKWE